MTKLISFFIKKSNAHIVHIQQSIKMSSLSRSVSSVNTESYDFTSPPVMRRESASDYVQVQTTTGGYVFNQVPVFNPEILKTGNESEVQTQLSNWLKGDNNSIFIKWVPDEFVDQTIARAYFAQFGDVDRIDFVPKYNVNKKQSGHMAFIHFHYFLQSRKQT